MYYITHPLYMYLDVAFYYIIVQYLDLPLFQTLIKSNVKTIPTLHGISCEMCRTDLSKSIFEIYINQNLL